MVAQIDFYPLSQFEWEIPKSFRPDMQIPVRVFASKKMLEDALKDKSIEQAVNASTLPGFVGWIAVMPDVHQGYGFPIGGVAASDMNHGVITPGGIGYDINCGVRLASSHISISEIKPYLSTLINHIYMVCPSGVGEKSSFNLSQSELEEICQIGSSWALKKGLATSTDVERTEDQGCIRNADPNFVSSRAKERGKSQLGTLGSGNHFIEIDIVDEIFESEVADVFGLFENCIAVQIHSGSRGLGHQVCTDYVSSFQSVQSKYHMSIPDRELVCAPISSKEGQTYMKAMRCAANFAFVNRQMLLNGVRDAFAQCLTGKVDDFILNQVYDITHNIGKVEDHWIDGKKTLVCVHRKGATRCFGPGASGLPDDYKSLGQPVLIPGSMGTSSWVLVGSQKSMEKTFGSCAHGAGRVLSRAQAKRQVWGEDLHKDLLDKGIQIKAGSMSGLAEEAPSAYKDVDEVIECVTKAGLAKKVARLRPLAVIKG